MRRSEIEREASKRIEKEKAESEGASTDDHELVGGNNGD